MNLHEFQVNKFFLPNSEKSHLSPYFFWIRHCTEKVKSKTSLIKEFLLPQRYQVQWVTGSKYDMKEDIFFGTDTYLNLTLLTSETLNFHTTC